MLQPNFFNSVFVFPILNVLVFFYKIFLTIHLPGAFGFSLIALTVAVRLLVHPFFKQQLESSKKMADIKPHLDRLNLKHKNDKKRLQEEQMKLYQQAGINPAGSCLFMIIQFPIFIALYQTLSLLLTNGHGAKVIAEINRVLYSPLLKITAIDPWFFGLNLALTPAKAKMWVYYLIPVITGVLQYLQTQATMPALATPAAEQSDKVGEKKKDEKKDGGGDFQKAMNTQMKYMFPLMIGYFAYTLPIGLSLYWNIFSIFSIMQYRQMKKK